MILAVMVGGKREKQKYYSCKFTQLLRGAKSEFPDHPDGGEEQRMAMEKGRARDEGKRLEQADQGTRLISPLQDSLQVDHTQSRRIKIWRLYPWNSKHCPDRTERNRNIHSEGYWEIRKN